MKRWISALLVILMLMPLVSAVPAWGDEAADAVVTPAETEAAEPAKEAPAETKKETEAPAKEFKEEKQDKPEAASAAEQDAKTDSSSGEEASAPAQQDENKPAQDTTETTESTESEKAGETSWAPTGGDNGGDNGEAEEASGSEGGEQPADKTEGTGEVSAEKLEESDEKQPEESSDVIEEGYAWLKKGARLYARKNLTGLLGTLKEDTVVYVLSWDEAAGALELVLAREGEALRAWADGKDAAPLTEAEIRKQESEAADLIWENTARLTNAAIDLKDSTAETPADEPGKEPEDGSDAGDPENNPGKTEDPEGIHGEAEDPEAQDPNAEDGAEGSGEAGEAAEGEGTNPEGETAEGEETDPEGETSEGEGMDPEGEDADGEGEGEDGESEAGEEGDGEEEEVPLTDEEFEELLAKEELLPPTLTVTGGAPAVTLSWTQINATNGYSIERRQLAGSKWKNDWAEIKSFSSYKSVKHTDNTTELGQVYQYRVRSRSTTGAVSEYSKPVGIYTWSASGNSLEVTDAKQSLKTLSWTKVAGATGYYLDRTDSKGATLRITISKVSTVKYTDTKVEPNTIYTYALRPYRKVGKEIYAAQSTLPEKTVSIYPMSTPELTGVEQVKGGTKLTWTASDTAQGYTIYYAEYTKNQEPPADAGKIKWKKAGTVKAGILTYTVKDKVSAKNGLVRRQYKVVATAKLGGKSKEGPSTNSSDLIYRMASPEKVTVTRLSTKNTVEVKWGEVKAAEGYVIRHRTGSSGSWEEIKVPSGTLKQNVTVKGATEHCFEVYAYASTPSGEQRSPQAAQVSIVPYWYYTLIVQQVHYDPYANDLYPCAKDGKAMYNTLYKQAVGGEGKFLTDATASEITGTIGSYLGQAEEDDVVIFYYTGHGAFDGSLCGVDGSLISTSDLEKAFQSIRSNHIILIVDACYSGALIEDIFVSKDLVSKNEPPMSSAFANAFTAAFSSKIAKNAEFAGKRYNVIAACGMEETSKCNSSIGSFATYYLNMSAGYDAKKQKRSSSRPGDKNKDKIISVSEAYNYAAPKVTSYMRRYRSWGTTYFLYEGEYYYWTGWDSQTMKCYFTEPNLPLYY